MRTSAISNNENRSFGVPKAGAVGAALGCAATYAFPLTTKEYKNYFTDAVKSNINSKAIKARRAEIAAITESLKGENVKPLVKDIFEKSIEVLEVDPKQAIANLAENNDLDSSIRGTLGELFGQVQRSGNATKLLENAKMSWAAKTGSRSALFNATLGMFIMMSVAILKETFDAFFPKKPEEPKVKTAEDEVIDYIINAAEGPAELYILERGFAKNKR